MTLDHTHVAVAYELAARNHRDQTDKLGNPYIHHVTNVAASVRHLGYEHEIVGVLHDAIEDTELRLWEIKNYFGPAIADAVDCLTKRDGESYAEYLARVMSNPIAKAVKTADARNNLSRSALIEDMETRDRLKRKYKTALRVLEAE